MCAGVQSVLGDDSDESKHAGDERLKDEELAQELSGICLGRTVRDQNDGKKVNEKVNDEEAKMWRAAELLRAPNDD